MSTLPSADAYASQTARYEPLTVIDVLAEQAAVLARYSNQPLLDINAACLRLAVFEECYRWHRHPSSDELFLVVEGALEIDLENGRCLVLGPWQCAVIPAGTVHRTRAQGRTVNLTVEEQHCVTEFLD